MKNKIILTAFMCLFFANLFAQEKGDKLLGLNFGLTKYNAPVQDTIPPYNFSRSSTSNSNLGLSYSYFTKLDRKINFGFGFYFDNPQKGPKSYQFSINVGYGMLYPIYEDFYVEVDPGFAYSYYKSDSKQDSYPASISKDYQLLASAGITWIPIKHFGMTVNLISLNFRYHVNTFGPKDLDYRTYSYGLNNFGSIKDQTFTIFYKFK
nr:hypothetical protein [Pseudopedobacter sp.]